MTQCVLRLGCLRAIADRSTGCARKSACGGPFRTQCVLRFSYLRAIADRRSKSCPGSGDRPG